MQPDRTVLVLASGNRGKLRELGDLLRPLGLELRPQSDWSVPEVAEDGLSFVENALIKARHAATRTGVPAIADDSGLVVPALDGAPGIHSARYAGSKAGDADNNRKLLAAMDSLEDERRNAFFHCAMVLMRSASDPVPVICSASWWGRIAKSPRGAGGFGYDPLFWVPECNCTSAELSAAEKNRRSHRAQAAAALLRRLQERDIGAC
jgi:XTP/dITP diphosphohydrolase